MKASCLTTVCGALLLALGQPAWADEPPGGASANDRATALVRELRDKSFKVRERARGVRLLLG